MDQFRRRLVFVAGMAGFVGAPRGQAQSTNAEDLPLCREESSKGGWTLRRTLGAKDDFGVYRTSSRLEWKNPDAASPPIASLSMTFSGAGDRMVSGSFAIRFARSSQLDRPFSTLQSGALRVEFDGTPLAPEDTGNKLTIGRSAGGRTYWTNTTTAKLGADMAGQLWTAIDRGTALKIVSLVPSDDHPGATVATTELSLAALQGVADDFERMTAGLVRQAGAKECVVLTSGCYLTTVCCGMVGLRDACFELRVLRRFRDEWLLRQVGGVAEIMEYERIAPRIAAAMVASGSGQRVGRQVYIRYILPSVALILVGQRRRAWGHYRRMVRYLETVFPPATATGRMA